MSKVEERVLVVQADSIELLKKIMKAIIGGNAIDYSQEAEGDGTPIWSCLFS